MIACEPTNSNWGNLYSLEWNLVNTSTLTYGGRNKRLLYVQPTYRGRLIHFMTDVALVIL